MLGERACPGLWRSPGRGVCGLSLTLDGRRMVLTDTGKPIVAWANDTATLEDIYRIAAAVARDRVPVSLVVNPDSCTRAPAPALNSRLSATAAKSRA